MSTSSTIGIRLALEGADKTEAGLRRVAGSMGSLESAATSVRSAVGGLAGVLAGSISVAGFVKAADAVTTLQNQLKLATGSAQAAGKAYEQLFEIAQRSRVSFTELGGTFASISRASESLGLSQRDLLSLTETIGNAITVSGASAQASNAALVQLSQGLASGVLRGEELNSIMEQTPRLARAIADGLNVPIGKLREMGQAGQLTAEQVINALRSQSAVLAGEVQQSVVTLGQAFTQLSNSATVLIGEFDRVGGVSSFMATEIQGASGALDNITSALKGTGAASKQTAVFADSISVAFEAVTVVGANVAYVIKQIGNEIGGMAAQAAAVASLNFGQAAAIRRDMVADAERARREIDALEGRILNARRLNGIAADKTAGLDTRAEDARLNRFNPTVRQAATAPSSSAKPKTTGGKSRASDIGDNERALASYVSSLQKTIDKENELTEVQKAQAFLRSIGVVGQVDQVRELVMSLAEQRDAQIALEKSTERLAELERIAADAENARVDALERSAQSVQDQVQKLLDEEKALQIAAAGNISLAQAIEQVNIARLQEEQARLMQAGDRDAEVLAIQKEIDARKKLAEAIGRQQIRDLAKDQAEEATREWKRAAQSIEQTLTDALMRGFESGKGFGENLAESLVNIFKTYVAREIAKAITNAIMSAVVGQNWAGVIGGALNGQAGGVAGNLASNGLTSAVGGMASSAIGNTVGAGNTGALVGGASGAMSSGNVYGSIAANGAVGAGGAAAGGSVAADGLGTLLASNGAYGTAAGGAAATSAGAAAGASSALAAIPVWGWVAIAAIALWQPLFGRKLKEAGMQATINSGQITTQEYQYFKGGLFRSDKTKVKDVDTPETRAFAQEVKNVQDSTAAMVRALGLSSASIENYSGKVRVNMKGVDNAAEAQQRMSEAMDKFRQQLAATVPGLDMSKKEFQKFVEGIQQSIQQAGISTEGLADIITQGMLGKMNASQVGEALSDMVIGGIYNSIASQYAGQIASVFTSQIITPIFTALAAGVPISQAISQQAIDQVVQTAKEAAAQLNAVFSDPGFRSAIAGVQEAISGISGAATSVRAPAYKAAASNYNAAADAAKRAAEETRRAWQGIADSITEEIRRIRGELLGDTTAGQSYYMAQFEDATRRARAGDQQAANRLPELSQAVLDIARATAGSLGELQFIQTSTIASLNQTRKIISQRFGLSIPAFADGGLHSGGIRLVGERGPELEVTGPARYFDARQTQKLMAGDPELTAKLDELIKATQRQADGISQIETNTRRTQQILDTVSQGGDSFVTVAA